MEDILLKLKQGDSKAFGHFFYLHKDAIYKYAFLHLKDEEIASDIVQDVFLKLWNRITAIDPEQNVRAYLYTITRHTVLEELRKKAQFSKFTVHVGHWQSISINNNEEQQEFQELTAIYHQAIALLPEKRKKIYQLSKLENRSHQEIAEHLDISINTVRDQLVKANKYVRTYILSRTNLTLPSSILMNLLFF